MDPNRALGMDTSTVLMQRRKNEHAQTQTVKHAYVTCNMFERNATQSTDMWQCGIMELKPEAPVESEPSRIPWTTASGGSI
jgi:hypothetical protein